MFSPSSRYADAATTTVTLADGRVVTALVIPRRAGPTALLGYHRRTDGQRLDLLAHTYLGDATRAWRLCDANGTICPDALAARPLVAIPRKDGG